MSKRTEKPSRATSGKPPKARASGAAAMAETSDIHTVAFVSLGCPKNLVDSEKMLGLLAEDGLTPTADEANADAVVINTCGFLEASKEESIGEITRAAEMKRQGKIKRIVVAGCLVQRHRAKMLDWCPDIDALIGVFDRDRIVEAVRGESGAKARAGANPGVALPVYSSIAASALAARKERNIDAPGYFESDSSRLRLTPRHYAYLRISEGCNQNCAFCTIPSIRGKMRSKPVDKILAEARELMADGAFELNLIGQDTTSYGQDIGYGPGLVGMLTALNDLAAEQGGAWIRLMYAYPSCFTDEMIDAIAKLKHVLKYIDMPLQHINDHVLDSMRRKTSRSLIETLLAKLRSRVGTPDAAPLGMALRTTFISGFPGETPGQHAELVAFLRSFRFDAMGVFPYSPEPGTPAGTMHAKGGAVADDAVQGRVDELMRTQQEIVFAHNQAVAEKGVELDVLIDGATSSAGRATTGVSKGGKLYAGRTYLQAPQIDGLTYVQSRNKLSPGELVRCRITSADGYDLVAQPTADLEKKRSLSILR
ncbi:MAG: 30S ribosomal protein S12 methylthiotransferase RimO [Planctomycetota bacterium]|nr:30S ribosomal protein S12 methylthiotransferase RimO [Planctomycetota bacterium]